MSRSKVRVDVRSALVKRAVRAGVGSELRKITLDLLAQSVKAAPVEEGILRGSGSAHFGGQRIATGNDLGGTGNEAVSGGHGTQAGGSAITAVVAFNTVYAEYQHEGVSRFSGRALTYHKGGGAKYLERPLAQNRALYLRRIRQAVGRALS